MYQNVFCSVSSNRIPTYLTVSLSVIILCALGIIPGAQGEPQIFEVGVQYSNDALNSTFPIKIISYENSSFGIKIDHPANWKPFEKTSATTNATIIEFVPFVESEHDPLTPFFSISIEDLEAIEASLKDEEESKLGTSINKSALEALTERNLELAESLPDFKVIELNNTSFLSETPAYKIVYPFADPGSPFLPLFESMNIWTVKDGKAYTISYSAAESEFSNYLQTIQNMTDSFIIRNDH